MLIGVLLLALVVVTGCTRSTAQQNLDLLCADSYADFEGGSVGSNVSGNKLRNQLYEAFYAPDRHFPFSVLVSYQLVLDNGTRFNLSSDQKCSTELWMWVSSPLLLRSISGSFYSAVFPILTLDYFTDRDPPHVTITTTVPPCPDKIGNFLSEMTASVSLNVSQLIALNTRDIGALVVVAD